MPLANQIMGFQNKWMDLSDIPYGYWRSRKVEIKTKFFWYGQTYPGVPKFEIAGESFKKQILFMLKITLEIQDEFMLDIAE